MKESCTKKTPEGVVENIQTFLKKDFEKTTQLYIIAKCYLNNRVQQGIQILPEGKLHKENTRRGGERLRRKHPKG